MGLYHKDVWMPAYVKNSVPTGVWSVRYTNHAITASKNDRYGNIPLPQSLDLSKMEIIEVEFNGECNKVVFREIGQKKNTVYVAIPERCRLIIKTVWINVSGDNHKTLNRNRYVTKKN